MSGGADSSTCAVLVSEMLKAALNQLTLKQLADDLPYLRTVLADKNFNEKTAYKELIPHVLSCAYQGTRNSGKTTLTAAQETRPTNWQSLL